MSAVGIDPHTASVLVFGDCPRAIHATCRMLQRCGVACAHDPADRVEDSALQTAPGLGSVIIVASGDRLISEELARGVLAAIGSRPWVQLLVFHNQAIGRVDAFVPESPRLRRKRAYLGGTVTSALSRSDEVEVLYNNELAAAFRPRTGLTASHRSSRARTPSPETTQWARRTRLVGEIADLRRIWIDGQSADEPVWDLVLALLSNDLAGPGVPLHRLQIGLNCSRSRMAALVATVSQAGWVDLVKGDADEHPSIRANARTLDAAERYAAVLRSRIALL